MFFYFLQASVCALLIGVNAQVGPSGIVSPDGKNVQFPHNFADDILLIGPAGIVTKSGKNLQLPASLVGVDLSNLRTKRAAPLVGPSGIVWPDGRFQQFTQSEVENHAVIGPSGIVNKDGSHVQFRLKRSAPLVGPSGIVYPDGRMVQFTHDEAKNTVLVGPSGIVRKDGNNVQLRKKRQATTSAGSISHAGIHRADGTIDSFGHDFAHDIIQIGPSGIITKNGPIQLTSDLKLVRAKRSAPIIGESGMILPNGQQIQFKTANAKIILEGPSGILLSDGTVIQKTS